MRAICGVGPLESCRPLFKSMNLLTLTCMYILEVSVFVKNHYLFFYFKSNNVLRSCRDPTRLVIPYYRATLNKRNVYHMCITIFNKLPRNLRELPKKYFKLKLRQWLISYNFYNLSEFMTYKN